jgi:gliding motility-associated-like protein
VITLPLPVFNLGNDTTLLIGNPLTIVGPMTMDEYAWNVAGETGPSLLVTASGLYALTVADEFGCEYSDTIFVDFITGLDYAMNGFFIEVPNIISRSDNQLIAKSNNVIVENVQIYDVLGKLVSNTNNFPVIWEGRTSGIELPTSTIYYHISYQTIDGQFRVKSGRLLIID